ncbi:MAG: glycosyl transferase family 2 [Halobacteriaceae archaeon]
MDCTQEHVATLHDYGEAAPDAPVERAAVVVPMLAQDRGQAAPARVLESLAAAGPGRLLVALSAAPEEVGPALAWLDGLDCDPDVLWCDGPRVTDLLGERGIDGPSGKGRDLWLAVGVAAERDYVLLHDADVRTVQPRDARKLIYPLTADFDFAKAYYARTEDGRLYGRLCRLFYDPLVETLLEANDEPLLDYLDAFRYGLAGECAMTTAVARRLRPYPGWGFEVGALGDAYAVAGAERSAQVDLGRYAHDHRAVEGAGGLSTTAAGVANALFQLLSVHGVDPDFDDLAARYRERARAYVRRYEADAGLNDFDYDAADERSQVATYARAIEPPGPDERLPAWDATRLDPDEVWRAARNDRRDAREA